jgi:hypothetical protein
MNNQLPDVGHLIFLRKRLDPFPVLRACRRHFCAQDENQGGIRPRYSYIHHMFQWLMGEMRPDGSTVERMPIHCVLRSQKRVPRAMPDL